MVRTLINCIVLLCLSCKENKKEAPVVQEVKKTYQTIGNIEKLSDRLDDIIDVNTPIEIISEGYGWSEGPLWLEKEQMLIWSDVPKNNIYSWKEGEGTKVYLSPAGYTEMVNSSGEGSNGLILSPEGKLVICQHGDRRLAIMNAPLNDPKPDFNVVVDAFDGKKFNSPNDAVYDDKGNLFFTDPPYGLTDLDNSKDKELSFNGVYKVDKEGRVTLLDNSLTRPNGIAFSPDFKKCYVANSDPEKAIWMAYDVTEENTFNNAKIFFDATNMVATKKGSPDGLKVTDDGTIFATGPGGILIFSPEGEHLGTINTEQATANCAFNADKSILYITAHSYIMRVQLK